MSGGRECQRRRSRLASSPTTASAPSARARAGWGWKRSARQSWATSTAVELVAEFTEVESGKRSDRPELVKAVEACRRQKARLVIAKLDRPSRNLAFIATLMESDVEFVAVDNPHANKLTVHILAAVAEHERGMISQRTKDVLAAAKRRAYAWATRHWQRQLNVERQR
jgi:DNA invertase Pin-like site-specific DNA recombinase